MKYMILAMSLLIGSVSHAQLAYQGSTPVMESFDLAVTPVFSKAYVFKNIGTTTVASSPDMIVTGPDRGFFKIAINRCTDVVARQTCQVKISSTREVLSRPAPYIISVGGAEIQFTVLKNGVIITPTPPPASQLELTTENDHLIFEPQERSKYVALTLKNIGKIAVVPTIESGLSELSYVIAINRCTSSLIPGSSCSLNLIVQNPKNPTDKKLVLRAMDAAQLRASIDVFAKIRSAVIEEPIVYGTLSLIKMKDVEAKIYATNAAKEPSQLIQAVSVSTDLQSITLPSADYLLVFSGNLPNGFILNPKITQADSLGNKVIECSVLSNSPLIQLDSGYSCLVHVEDQSLTTMDLTTNRTSGFGFAFILSEEYAFDLHSWVGIDEAGFDRNYLTEQHLSDRKTYFSSIPTFPENGVGGRLHVTLLNSEIVQPGPNTYLYDREITSFTNLANIAQSGFTPGIFTNSATLFFTGSTAIKRFSAIELTIREFTKIPVELDYDPISWNIFDLKLTQGSSTYNYSYNTFVEFNPNETIFITHKGVEQTGMFLRCGQSTISAQKTGAREYQINASQILGGRDHCFLRRGQ